LILSHNSGDNERNLAWRFLFLYRFTVFFIEIPPGATLDIPEHNLNTTESTAVCGPAVDPKLPRCSLI
jgi:hypothetical protein